jgi:aminoglycoside 3-N-acetyltransferase
MADYDCDIMARALRQAGIEEGDTVLFHMSLGMLGVPAGVNGQEELNRHFLECARTVLGPEGTMLVPAYTYSLCRGETFDPRSTPSAIGPFPEFFRRQPGVMRSAEPILSVCAAGPMASELFADLPPTSYGPGCLYSRMVERGTKICTVGLGLNWATILHHIEEMAGVPYRYRKIFRGDMADELGRVREVEWIYSVRLWSDNADVDARELTVSIVKDGVCSNVPLGRSGLCCVRADRYFEYAAAKMRENPWIAAKGPAGDPLELEAARVPATPFNIGLTTDSTLEEMAARLTPLPRDSVGDASDAALEALSAVVPMTLHAFRTGQMHARRIIPEKWTCEEASLRDLQGKILFSTRNNPLHVVQRSHPFEGEVSRSELFEHLHVLPGAPDALPFVRNNSRRMWGLCCSASQRDTLTDASYRVSIRAAFSFGRMLVGEAAIQGSNPSAELVLCAHLGNPGQFNDGLSGVLAGVEAMRAMLAIRQPRLTRRLVVFPGEEGLAAWLGQAGPHPGRFVVFLNMLATPAPLLLARTGETPPLAEIFSARLQASGARTLDAAPSKAGPAAALLLQKVSPQAPPGSPFPGHGTHADTPDAFAPSNIRPAVQVLLDAVEACEAVL